MNKNFNKLTTYEKIKFINTELKKNNKISISKLFKNFGLNKGKIINDFKKEGYVYDPSSRNYIKDKLIQNNNDYKLTASEIKDIREILSFKVNFKSLMQSYNKNKSIDSPNIPNELKIDMKDFKGDLKNRLIKVYGNINCDWMKFCEKNKQYKMQDLYSKALKEFMEKYN